MKRQYINCSISPTSANHFMVWTLTLRWTFLFYSAVSTQKLLMFVESDTKELLEPTNYLVFLHFYYWAVLWWETGIMGLQLSSPSANRNSTSNKAEPRHRLRSLETTGSRSRMSVGTNSPSRQINQGKSQPAWPGEATLAAGFDQRVCLLTLQTIKCCGFPVKVSDCFSGFDLFQKHWQLNVEEQTTFLKTNKQQVVVVWNIPYANFLLLSKMFFGGRTGSNHVYVRYSCVQTLFFK